MQVSNSLPFSHNKILASLPIFVLLRLGTGVATIALAEVRKDARVLLFNKNSLKSLARKGKLIS
jgi:hypothetical protein